MNLDYENYKTSDLEELNKKINHRFIRNIVKPYNNSLKKPTYYQIPKSSDLTNYQKQKTPLPVEFFNNDYGKYSYAKKIEPREEFTPMPTFIPTMIELNCKNVHGHIKSCEICTKLYQPYNSILMVIIVILIIIILFMIKRMYNF